MRCVKIARNVHGDKPVRRVNVFILSVCAEYC